jgi:hypothetical protein
MKAFITANILALLFTTNVQASKLNCNLEQKTVETIKGHCDDGYAIEITGIGMLRVIPGQFVVDCPWTSDPVGTYYGYKGPHSQFEGTSVGMYVGLGPCFVGGFDTPVYAGNSSFEKLRISKGP